MDECKPLALGTCDFDRCGHFEKTVADPKQYLYQYVDNCSGRGAGLSGKVLMPATSSYTTCRRGVRLYVPSKWLVPSTGLGSITRRNDPVLYDQRTRSV